jgi:hypothetical protein
MGALLIAVVSATALVPASTQALTWSISPTPRIPGTVDDGFFGVSCPSASFCAAVGTEGHRKDTGAGTVQALIESWNGTRWSAVPSPKSPPDTELFGVSCVSAAFCTAAGLSVVSFSGDVTEPLIESWNGTKWSVVPNPGRQGAGFNGGVSCVSATFCVAVGTNFNLKALIESWNGTKWSIVPAHAGTGESDLVGVSCISASNCTAVGDRGSLPDTLIETWNGKRWSAVPSPTKGHEGDFLNGVWCTSASFCVAAGVYTTANISDQTLIESWNGTKWSIAPVPTARESEFNAVSCVSSNDCWAAGEAENKAGNARTYVNFWNGTRWSVVPTPNVGSPRTAANLFFGVSCPSASFCAADGNWSVAKPSHQLIEIGTHGG